MLSFIVRRTLDPYADEIEYVAQIKLTTNCLDMFPHAAWKAWSEVQLYVKSFSTVEALKF